MIYCVCVWFFVLGNAFYMHETAQTLESPRLESKVHADRVFTDTVMSPRSSYFIVFYKIYFI